MLCTPDIPLALAVQSTVTWRINLAWSLATPLNASSVLHACLHQLPAIYHEPVIGHLASHSMPDLLSTPACSNFLPYMRSQSSASFTTAHKSWMTWRAALQPTSETRLSAGRKSWEPKIAPQQLAELWLCTKPLLSKVCPACASH